MIKYSDIVEKRNAIWRLKNEIVLIDDFKDNLAKRSKAQITLTLYGENPVLALTPLTVCVVDLLKSQQAMRKAELAQVLQWFVDNGIDSEVL